MTNINYHSINTPYLYSLICYRPRSVYTLIYFPMTYHPLLDQDLLITRLHDHTQTHTHSVGLLLTTDQHDADISTGTTNNAHKQRTSMLPAGFEPAIPPNKRPQTHSTDRTATGIGV